jgi:hypothetical protein
MVGIKQTSDSSETGGEPVGFHVSSQWFSRRLKSASINEVEAMYHNTRWRTSTLMSATQDNAQIRLVSLSHDHLLRSTDRPLCKVWLALPIFSPEALSRV